MRKTTTNRYVTTLPDPKFGDVIVTKFVNNLMYDGKKNKAFDIFYSAIDIVAEKSGEDGLEVWRKALGNVTPQVEVRSRRVGGANFQIPQPVRDDRKRSLAMKWLIGYSRGRNERSMAQKLANEILAAAKEEGAAFKKKEEVHKMAEANKAFSHFRF
ncbi:MAG: 30S ribosomal protein S7 [Flavobacteriales bacterium]|jgi:small subunit ribosomal protein S7|nr:30S ribosomal protein S7 [Flavobacteriales bacterium]MBK7269864.1 30S ribosomal protein S7 [Flavobacteriales bacterium]MBK7753457.1 30S ribosomal protein S7 [Flavobacteriales bacterium]MBK9077107.1 30S ribosomal protein S7 [Flavobacteriales bacterium]MBK9538527.1 30S ribosomal protein S7 [Flavobacteriales bacterium]